MKVRADNVWATPAGLHLRITVWNNEETWRHKYDVMVPAAEISPEAVCALFEFVADDKWSEDLEDSPLF